VRFRRGPLHRSHGGAIRFRCDLDPSPRSPRRSPAAAGRRPGHLSLAARRSFFGDIKHHLSRRNLVKAETSNIKHGFTLVELLVVISIIIILMGLLFPAFKGAQDQAKRAQAKNDLTQIVTAVNAFYTEYGRYPTTATSDAFYGPGNTNSKVLFDELRGKSSTVNTRQIVFMNIPDVKDTTTHRAGIGSDGQFYDPWGFVYGVGLDSNYDNKIINPYGNNTGAGVSPLSFGAISWSLGKDGVKGIGGKFTGSDDVISWQ
jgi:prepilin-type N-terminal cleavage/methylation domain-containing protein